MKIPINCSKCGTIVIKKYGHKDLCNSCHTKNLNLSARGKAEIKKLRDELKRVKAALRTIRTAFSNHKLSLKAAARTNQKLREIILCGY